MFEIELFSFLVPMFLIISSSVYPAIMSGIENKEMPIVTKVIAQLKGNDVLLLLLPIQLIIILKYQY